METKLACFGNSIREIRQQRPRPHETERWSDRPVALVCLACGIVRQARSKQMSVVMGKLTLCPKDATTGHQRCPLLGAPYLPIQTTSFLEDVVEGRRIRDPQAILPHTRTKCLVKTPDGSRRYPFDKRRDAPQTGHSSERYSRTS